MKTLYENGSILTMESKFPVEALIEEDGVIRFAGTHREALQMLSSGDKRVDLCGHTLMPGFIDGHSHLTGLASAMTMVRLEGCRNFAEIAQRIREFIEVHRVPENKWVCGVGYDHNMLTEKRHPDRRLLDVFSKNPVLITHQSGHMGVVNQQALKLIGIDAAAPDPAGGHIGRTEDGELTGYLEESAFTGISRMIPPPPEEERMQAMLRAEEEYLRKGFTTIQDGLISREDWKLVRRMDEEEKLRADVVCYHSLTDEPELSDQNPAYDRKYGRHLKLGGYKIFLDGSPQGRTAWISEPYEGGKNEYGYPTHTDAETRALMKKALEDHRQILVHCNGDAAAQQMIDSYRWALHETGCQNIRPVMVHAQLVRCDQLKQMGELSMMASVFVAHVFHWGDIHLKNLGERAIKISPMASAAAAGVCTTMHQDTPVLPPDMLESVWCAAARKTKNGVQLDENECIGVYEALRAATINGAFQYFEESTKGTLSPGKRADMIILDQNPMTAAVEEIPHLQVLATIKDGKTVYSCKK